MTINQILPGTKIDICLAARDNKPASEPLNNYLSSVFDVRGNDIYIHMPTKGGRIVLLPENVEYEFVFSIDNQMYQSVGVVIKRGKIENFHILVVRLNKELSKLQRRAYYRFDCMIPLVYASITEDVALVEGVKEFQKAYIDLIDAFKIRGIGTILDLSGGGARFISSSNLEGVGYLYLQFGVNSPKGRRQIEVPARLVRSEYKSEIDKYEHRAQFIFKDLDDREVIIKYIFDEERRLRKKDQG